MKEHYNINDVEWKELSLCVSTMDLIKSVPEFDPHNAGEPLTKVSLMYYIDKHGDFNEGDSVHNKIAKAIFKSLGAKDKVEIFSYLQWYEEQKEIA